MTNLCKEPHYCLVKRALASAPRLLPLFALLVAAGCASPSLKSEALVDLERQVVELRRSQADSKAHREEMNNKLLLLQERVIEDRRVVDKLRHSTFSLTPPEELRVIKLSEADGQQVVKEVQGHTKEKGGTERVKEKSSKGSGNEPAQSVKKSAPPKPTVPISYEPEDFYRRGQDLFWSGKMKEAVNLFKRFTEEYPKHHLADNALYWTGEAYYSQEKYRKALDQFMELIEEYPKGNKAPDALLKVAYSYMELDRNNDAEKALMSVIETYPGSESAIKARQTITELFTDRRGEQ
ncbi:MAG: tol-pal system protein YbgF [Thermodesulfobacteriota bacterium]